MPDSLVTRFLGGSPLTVVVRLVAVSLVVGAFMAWLGIDAMDLVDDLQRGFVHLYGTGFAALHDIGRTLVAGAAVVLPVWFVLRLLSYRGPRPAAFRSGQPCRRSPTPRRRCRAGRNPERVGSVSQLSRLRPLRLFGRDAGLQGIAQSAPDAPLEQHGREADRGRGREPHARHGLVAGHLDQPGRDDGREAAERRWRGCRRARSPSAATSAGMISVRCTTMAPL